MNCNCNQDLGCFLPGDVIDFGVVAYCDGDYIFEITSRGLTVRETVTFAGGADIVLTNNFTESGEIKIKIKVPQIAPCSPQPGFNYITSPGGACVFLVHSEVGNC